MRSAKTKVLLKNFKNHVTEARGLPLAEAAPNELDCSTRTWLCKKSAILPLRAQRSNSVLVQTEIATPDCIGLAMTDAANV